MNKSYAIIAAVAIASIHLVHNILFSPMGAPASLPLPPPWCDRVFYFAGVFLSQSPLLAAWAIYGPGAFAPRSLFSFGFALFLGLANTYSQYVNQNYALELRDFTLAFFPLVNTATIFGILSLWQAITVRRTGGKAQVNTEPKRWSIRHIFGATILFAVFMTGLSMMLHTRFVDGQFDILSIWPIALGFSALAIWNGPIVATVLIVVRGGCRKMVLFTTALLLIQQIVFLAVGILLNVAQLYNFMLTELVISITMHTSAVVAALPYHLFRRRPPACNYVG